MPANPTTKSQVQAYKFVLRRMQSALTRKDAVMLHDPMRTHSRATVVGVVLSALGILGFVIAGFFSPEPAAPESGSIVIGEQSGAMYVMTGEPKKLIPTFNIASARLLLLAQQQKGQGSGGSSAPSGGSQGPVEATVIPDEQLAGIPRGRPTGIPSAPDALPGPDRRISPNWSVCDYLTIDENLPENVALRQATAKTTVLGGVSTLGRELGDNEAMLVQAEGSGKTYLVYRPYQKSSQQAADVVRAPVNLNEDAMRSALGLTEHPRPMSMEMLNAIPEAEPLQAPTISGAGTPGSFGLDLQVGSVFSSTETEGKQYYVVTKGGIQEVSRAVADMVRAKRSTTGDIPSRAPDQVAGIQRVPANSPYYLPVAEYPRSKPQILKPAQVPSACLGWGLEGEGEKKHGRTTIYVGTTSPVPTDSAGNSKAIQVGKASPDGYKVDQFFMPPGKGAVVQSATSDASFGAGPILLVSDQGIRYGVPNQGIAKALGLTPQDPAPELILRLLPTGATLDVSTATKSWNAGFADPAAGSYPSQSQQPAG